MPKASAAQTTSRHWQILQRLPTRAPGLTVTELADHLRHEHGFDLTKRTIERDLVELATLFPLTTHDETKPYRWRWREGSKLELAGLDLADALSLVLAEQMITPLLPASLLQALAPRFALARSKLAALGTHRFTRWSEKVRHVPAALNLQPPRIVPEVLAQVQEALLHETCVTITYLAPTAAKTQELTLHPLSLIQRGPVLYLAATAFDYEDVRLYALHRMTRPRLLEKPRRIPTGFSIDAYIDSGALDFGAGKTTRLRARVSDELSIYLTETQVSADQKVTGRPGDYLLTATVQDSWQLRFWILSQGPAITVLAPAELRRSIINTLDQAAANYRQPWCRQVR